jgi:rhamnogalacturonan endolyase
MLAAGMTLAQAQTANLQDRALWGSIAVAPGSGAINLGDYQTANNKMLLTWRRLPGDTEETAFNLWRKMGDNGTWSCVNDVFKTGKKGIKGTSFQHAALSTVNGDLHYRLTYADPEVKGADMNCDEYIGEYTMTKAQAVNKLPYIEIPLQPTDDCSDYPNEFKYQANDCSVGDLDGDGQMEIVVKRLLTVYNSEGQITATSEGAADTDKRARHIAIFDAYKLDGTFLWRVKSGPNIIAGNSINFAVADLDGDGCSEVVTKTSEGTVFSDGYEIPDTDGDGKVDYRDIWPAGHYTGDGPKGYGGPEFFSVIDGKTGRELARANFICRGKEGETPAELAKNYEANDWKWDPRTKKYWWKLANSLRLGVARFKSGSGLQVFLGRGVYGRTVVEGWQYDPTPTTDFYVHPEIKSPETKEFAGTLTRLWKIDTDDSGGKDVNKDGKPFSAYAGQGNHAFNVADLDGDGLDEVMYGSCAWDNDGTGLWSTGLGHGDANHVGVFQKDYEGLQVYHCLESGKTEVALHDAKTGNTIWAVVAATEGDQGRCMVADVDPTSPGCEFWKYGNELYNQNGEQLCDSEGNRKKESSANAGIWFDGYLNRQMIDGGIINSYSHGRTFTMYRYDISFNNSTKSNPGWYGDMLGDWREEVIVPDATKLNNIKVFSTWYPTEHSIPWLMLDHTYYMQCIHEQVGYNQPTNVGFYMGSEMTDEEIWDAFWKANPQAPDQLVGDVNGDGLVNALDIQKIINVSASGSHDSPYDLNGDGLVNALDIQKVINIAANAARGYQKTPN